jgi:hypothetical protein
VIDLPDPDSPTRPSTSPRASEKLTSSTAFTDARLGEEVRAQPLDLEQGVAHRCNLGFRTSRSWSATRLIDTIVSRRAMPGKKLIQYLPDSRYW